MPQRLHHMGPPHPFPHRFRTWLGERLRARRVSYVVDLEGHRFKRTVLADTYQASRVAANLEEFASDDVYPSLLWGREREIWLEWIDGERVTQPDRDVVAQLARLLSVLHRRRPRKVASEATPFPVSLRRDLHFLHRVGLLEAKTAAALQERAIATTPLELWVGYDCTDTTLKNFIRGRDGRIRGIDVESFADGQLLGIGPAKACLRWVGPYREMFLSEIRAAGSPDFRRYFEFVELAVLASWQKASVLQGRQRLVDAALFDRFGAPQ